MRRRGRWPLALILAGALAAGAIAALVVGGSGRPKSAHGGTPPPVTTGPPVTTTPSATTGPPVTTPASAPLELGVNANRLYENPALLRRLTAQLSALAATGASTVRTDALWEAAEPSPPSHGVHHYAWGFDDLIAASLAQHRLRWLALLDYSAGWAQSVPGRDHSPPANTGDYAAYAGAFAARYGPGGAFWSAHPELPAEPVQTIEIWNEPDNPVFWYPHPDATAYAGLYLAARAAIDAVSPQIRVLVGGLSDAGRFLPALMAARPDLAGHVDGIAFHPYAPTPAGVLAAVVRDRGILDAVGLGSVPLYVTEFGWTTSPPGAQAYLPARLRPAYIETTVAGLGHLDCGVAGALLYTWVTEQRDPADSQQWYGVAPPGGGPSADVQALTAGVQAATAGGTRAPCR